MTAAGAAAAAAESYLAEAEAKVPFLDICLDLSMPFVVCFTACHCLPMNALFSKVEAEAKVGGRGARARDAAEAQRPKSAGPVLGMGASPPFLVLPPPPRCLSLFFSAFLNP